MNNSAMSKPRKIAFKHRLGLLSTNEQIDVCRGLFAYLVVVAHAIEVSFSMLPSERAQLGAFGGVFAAAAGSGVYWVMGFFVISGYCIQLSVQRMCERGSFQPGTYFIARASRLLPLYYLALAFAVVVELWIAPVRPANWPHGINYQVLVCQVLLLQNLTQTYGSFSPSWSITNEAFYYAFFGALVVASSRIHKRPERVGLVACVLLGWSMYFVYRFALKSPAFGATALLFGLGTHWFAGAIIAAHRDFLARSALIQIVARAWPLVLAASIACKALVLARYELVLAGSGFAFALMLIRFLGCDTARSGHAQPPARVKAVVEGLGLSSYPTYLLHGPILMLVGSMLIRLGLPLGWVGTSLLLSAAGIACGILGGYLLEAPIMAWRAGLLRRLSSAGGRDAVGGQARISFPAAGS